MVTVARESKASGFRQPLSLQTVLLPATCVGDMSLSRRNAEHSQLGFFERPAL